MKAPKFISILALRLRLLACTSRCPPDLPKQFAPRKAQVVSVSYLLGINFGSFLKGYNFGSDLNYSEIVKGMKDFVNAKGDYRDPDFDQQFKINPNAMNEAFNSFLEKRQNAVLLANKEKSEKFLQENAKKEGVQTTESGLQYVIVEPGSDVKPGPEDTVTVRYKGTTVDGVVFDEVAPDAEPISFPLNQVVKGWTEGLQLIGEGGKIELFIPSHLGYGEQGNSAIEPNSALIFTVELVKVERAAAE